MSQFAHRHARRVGGAAAREITQPGALEPGATIGIVGGGQLGRMLAIAAARLGYRSHVLTDAADSPGAQVAAAVTVGGYSDPAALAAFADAVDRVTFEFENISAEGLDLLAARRPVHPSPAVLRVSQDRIAEKAFVNDAGALTAPWRAVGSPADLAAAVAALGLPAVLKTTRLGYDGRGQAVLRTAADLESTWASLAPQPLILEGFVDFACEISVIVARAADGTAVAYDAVENRHLDGILDMTLAPARIPEATAERARALAIGIAATLDVVGLLAVEMFVDRNGEVLVNELAPRPHNSGHWTIEACAASQFEQHVRAIAGLPLAPAHRHADAVMKNLVGPAAMARWPDILATPGLIPHHYGKQAARPARKLGHVTRLFPRGSLPGELGVEAALAVLG